MSETLLTLNEVAEQLGIGRRGIWRRAQRREITGELRRQPSGQLARVFTPAEVARLTQKMSNAPKTPRQAYRLSDLRGHCPRCEILTPDGALCEECRFVLAYGRYPTVNELTGVVV